MKNTCALVGLVCLGLWIGAGCTTLRSASAPDAVVAARQRTLQGMESLRHGRRSEAETLFAEAIALSPSEERAQYLYAETLWQRGERDLAIRHLEEAVRLSGGDAERLTRLGEMHLAMGNLELAWRQAQRAIRSHRELAEAWALLGDVKRQQQDLAAAMPHYHRALSLRPQYPRVQTALAEIYLQQGRPRRGLSTIRSLRKSIAPDQVPHQVQLLEGIALKQSRRYSDAIEILTELVVRHADSAEALYHLSESHLLAGDPASAEMVLHAALSVDPRHEAARALEAHLRTVPPTVTRR